MRTLRKGLRRLTLLALLLSAAQVHAQGARYQIRIGPNDARAALGELARQTDSPLLYLDQDIGERVVHGVYGLYTVNEALRLMLEDTGLQAQLNENGVITVSLPAATGSAAEASVAPQAAGEGVTAPREAIPAAPRWRQPALEEVLVTGSRLRPAMSADSAVPVTSIRPRELEAFEPSGTLAEQLDVLPQFFGTQTAQRGGGALFGTAGGSYLDMRGMGAARTLVLFDGSRVVPADRGSTVNIDTLPTALLRDVEIVAGGASAAYGADALAGVVNFVLDREFEGLELGGGSGLSARGDGHNWNFSAAGGRRLGARLHLIGSLEARKIHQIERPPDALGSFRRWGYVTNPDWSPDDPPGTHPRLLILPDVHSSVHSPAGLINQPGFRYDRQTFIEDGTATRPFLPGDVSSFSGPGSSGSQSGGPEARLADLAFNGGPFGAEVVNRSAFLGLQYRVDPGLRLFGQLMLGHTESNQNHRRGNPHLQSDTWHATIYRENAFLPEDIRQAMTEAGLESIRVDKLGQIRGKDNFNDDRNDRNTHRMSSFTAGLDKTLGQGWNLRASWQHGVARKTTAVYGNLRIDRLFLAIDAVRDPETGAIVCNVQLSAPTEEQLRAATAGVHAPAQQGVIRLPAPIGLDGSVRDCVPLNIFGTGNATRAAADYVVGDKVGLSEVEQDFAEALLTGDLFVTAHGPVSVATGFTWRQQAFWQYSTPSGLDGPPRNAPELGIRGIPPGFTGGSTSLFQFSGVPSISGGFHVWEAFGEVNVPLWHGVDANLAYRSSDYSLSGRVESWKLGADVPVLEGLRLRATVSRDVREATFSERFDVQGVGGNVNDPAFGGANVEITTFSGGNPSLKPEKADTITLGFVYAPVRSELEGLRLSAHWYEIDLRQAIGQPGQQRIVNECHAGVLTLCEQVTRNDEGILVAVSNVFMNIDAARVRGVDLDLLYGVEPDFLAGAREGFRLRLLAGYLSENSTTVQGGQRMEQAGGLNWPRLTATLTASYDVGALGVRVQQRYIDDTLLNVAWREGEDVDDNSVSSHSVTNLGLSYTREDAAGGMWRLALDVNNLWDREPPVIPSFSQRAGAQTVSHDYDVFGRRYQLSFRMEFQ